MFANSKQIRNSPCWIAAQHVFFNLKIQNVPPTPIFITEIHYQQQVLRHKYLSVDEANKKGSTLTNLQIYNPEKCSSLQLTPNFLVLKNQINLQSEDVVTLTVKRSTTKACPLVTPRWTKKTDAKKPKQLGSDSPFFHLKTKKPNRC